MISRISLLKCKEGVSEEAFREGMMGDVRDVIARMPQLRKCEIDFVTDRQQRSHLGRGAIDIDGFIEMFFDSYGDMVRGSGCARGIACSRLRPIRGSRYPALAAVKKVDTPVPAFLDGVKLIKRMSFLGRKDGVSAAVFQDEWWQMHSALVKTMTGYAGYNQNLVIDRIVDGESVPFEELPIEGVVEFWFENMKAFDECYGTPAFKRTGAHGAEFIDNITTYLVEAKPIAMEQA